MKPVSGNRSGLSMLSILIALSLVAGASYAVSKMVLSARKAQQEALKRIVAESFSAELLESFVSQGGNGILAYFGTNPQNGALPPYYLCAHINLLDRVTGVLINSDPNAALPNSALEGSTATRAANRFYIIQVVDVSVTPPAILPQHCNKTTATFVAGNANERLLVTVGTTWVDHDKPIELAHRVTLSGLVPVW